MANMSYCMFENTLRDMQQVHAAMRDARNVADLDMGEHETAAFKAMGPVLDEMVEMHEALLETLEEDND